MNRPDSTNGNPGEEKAYRILYLVKGFIRQTLSDAEQDELDAWIEESPDNLQLFADLTDETQQAKALHDLQLIDTEQALLRIKQKMDFSPQPKSYKPKYINWLAAASVLLIAFISVYLLFFRKPDNAKPALTSQMDILPGTKRAVLQLSNGSLLQLSTAGTGFISTEENIPVSVTKNAELVYSASPNAVPAGLFHILTIPRGGQFALQLPDGSKVWLNSASSLKYPLQFNNNERTVELTGEGYFEVAPDAKRPFTVLANKKLKAEVLGTHFNINSYADEETILTSLLEGSIKVSAAENDKYVLLKPGEQAGWTAGKPLQVTGITDTTGTIAWKNNYFQFKNMPLDAIMRQVARWYDVEFIFEKEIPFHFNLSIEKNVKISRLLELLEMTNRVHFTIEGRTIIVRP